MGTNRKNFQSKTKAGKFKKVEPVASPSSDAPIAPSYVEECRPESPFINISTSNLGESESVMSFKPFSFLFLQLSFFPP